MARPRTNAQRAAQAAAAEPTSTASYEAPVAAPVAALHNLLLLSSLRSKQKS